MIKNTEKIQTSTENPQNVSENQQKIYFCFWELDSDTVKYVVSVFLILNLGTILLGDKGFEARQLHEVV